MSAARLARGFLHARRGRSPMLLSHLITGRCNACCPTCLWRDADLPELSTASVRWLYRQAPRAGIRQVVLWGGEPLLREDLPGLLADAARAGLVVTLITNGWLLEERWPQLRGSVDALILSLDDVGPAHDRLRGLPGSFSRLEHVAAGLKNDPARPRLLINTVLSRANRGALRRVAAVAAAWGAGLYFCPMETGQLRAAGFEAPLAHLALDAAELREAARTARLLKDAGYPLLSSDRYLDRLERDPRLLHYTCRAPRLILTVQADGAVRDCVRRDVPLVSVDRLRRDGGRLSDVFEDPRYRQMLADAERCTVCNNPDVIEMSWLWDLELQMAGRVARLVLG